MLKFGEISYFDTPMFDFVVACIIGVVCGILGAFFIYTYSALGFIRKKHVNTPFKKILEVVLFSAVSTSLFYWLSAACKLCYDIEADADYESYFKFTCATG